MATLNLLKRIGKRAYRRVGRGNGSSRGKQSGRGGKGQTARAGHKVRPELRDIIKKLPKRRGYGKNRGRTVVGSRPDSVAVSLARLDQLFTAGSEVTPKALFTLGVISRHLPPVKIVGDGEFTKKLMLKDVGISASARAAIEKAGGTITLQAPKFPAKARKHVEKVPKEAKEEKTHKAEKSAQGGSTAGRKEKKS